MNGMNESNEWICYMCKEILIGNCVMYIIDGDVSYCCMKCEEEWNSGEGLMEGDKRIEMVVIEEFGMVGRDFMKGKERVYVCSVCKKEFSDKNKVIVMEYIDENNDECSDVICKECL